MEDLTALSVLRSHAQRLCDHPIWEIHLSPAQALEIAVALSSTAPSWDEFQRHPQEPRLLTDIDGYLSAIARTQRRLLALNAAPMLSRGMRSMLSMHYTALLADVAESPYSLLWSALRADGAKVSSILENGALREATISDGLGALQTLLGSWYFFLRHRGAPPWPWELTQQLALSMGFTAQEAQIIRTLQREAPNHAWDIDLWFEVGALDPDPAAFLEELRMQPQWPVAFERLYETDGGRGSYG
jgi:hypothetical protein